MSGRAALRGLVLLAGVSCPLTAVATTITIVNVDAAGKGFNDPLPRTPVGGNGGTTLGQQRLNVFQYAANFWAQRLTSPVEILVRASFSPLACSSTSATLGSAGASTVFSDFTGAPRPGTWYPSALANKLAGMDLNPPGPGETGEDIQATFTTALDDGSCAFPMTWYYGLDASPTGGTTDFASVIIHELGHGLGFQTYVSRTSGARLLGVGDTYMINLYDGTVALTWNQMTDAQRLASTTNTGNLLWTGPAVVAVASGRLGAGVGVGGRPRMYAPNPSESGSSVSHWDTVLTPNEIMEPSYTGANHNLLITRELMTDIGWGAPATCGTITGAVTGGGTICAGGSSTVTVTVSGGTAPYTLALTNGGGSQSGAGPAFTFTVSPASTTTYSVASLSDSLACAGTGSGSATVTVKATPAAPAAGNGGPYVTGATISLTASTVSGATYSWTGPNGFSSALQNPTRANATSADAGVYSVRATVNGCTSAAGTTTVVVGTLWPLTVSRAGTGQGTVTSSPAGISCGGTCVASFVQGDPVVLTALAAAGSHFTGWSGEGCAGTGSCAVTMSQARAVTATFDLDPTSPQSLAVTVAGNGAVTSVPTGISCPGTCNNTFPAASMVTLTAVPGLGYRFGGWAGAGCAGTGTCALTMNAPTSVTATFVSVAASRYYPITPCRAVDTRNAAGPLGGPALAAASTRGFTLAGACGIPADATAVSLNVTVADASAAGTLTIYPGTGPATATNTMNFVVGKNRANNVTVGLVGGGLSVVDYQATGTVNLIVDVNGYYR